MAEAHLPRAFRRPQWLLLVCGAFVLLWLILAAFPLGWTAWGSLKVQADFFSRQSWWNALTGANTERVTGSPFTGAGYYGAWVVTEFWRATINTALVTLGVVTISLTFGTLGGYALARSTSRWRFAILLFALFFRAMPEVALVSGYLYPFFVLNLWGHLPTAIVVLVALNQPFTLWMMYSFFLGVPRDLDESALVDGCNRFQAFRLAIMPVMWPGVITTGLFAFLLAYNDFTVTGLILSEQNRTMIPKIASYLGSVQAEGNVMFAVAAVVSVTVPIFLLVMFFQRYLVTGLTAGAVKG
jgi:ABC-type glycerol-3-phosphate transport system permease component